MKEKTIWGIIFALALASFPACGEEETEFFEEINYDDLSRLIVDGKTPKGGPVVIIDVRPEVDFNGVKGHIQDAINIPLEKFQADNTLLTSKISKSKTIVTYCFGYGNDKIFADTAKNLGYKKIYYYLAGTDDWQTKSDYFVLEYAGFKKWHEAQMATGSAFADDENYLVDDLPTPWYEGTDPDHPGGHIPCAVSIPLSAWYDSGSKEKIDNAASFTNVVTNKNAKVVIYCGNWACGLSLWGARVAAEMGYSDVYRYQGGQKDWFEQSNPGVEGTDPCDATN